MTSSLTVNNGSCVFSILGSLRDCSSPSFVVFGQSWHLNIITGTPPICQLVYDGIIQLSVKICMFLITSDAVLPGDCNGGIATFSLDNNKVFVVSRWWSRIIDKVTYDRKGNKIESYTQTTGFNSQYNGLCNIKFRVEMEEIPSEQTLQSVSDFSSIQFNFSQILMNDEDYDFVFVVGDVALGVHKLILCARSSVLKTMIKSDMKETVSNKIVITDFEYDIVKGLVSFMYTEDCGGTLLQDKPELFLMIAHKYAIYGLVQRCVNELSSTLTSSNALERLVLASTYDLSVLKLNCMLFMRHNKNALIVGDGQEKLRMLPVEVYVELMKYVA